MPPPPHPSPRKSRPLLRRMLKWGGLVITLLLVAVWIVSTRRYLYIRRDFNSGQICRIEIFQGVIEF